MFICRAGKITIVFTILYYNFSTKTRQVTYDTSSLSLVSRTVFGCDSCFVYTICDGNNGISTSISTTNDTCNIGTCNTTTFNCNIVNSKTSFTVTDKSTDVLTCKPVSFVDLAVAISNIYFTQSKVLDSCTLYCAEETKDVFIEFDIRSTCICLICIILEVISYRTKLQTRNCFVIAIKCTCKVSTITILSCTVANRNPVIKGRDINVLCKLNCLSEAVVAGVDISSKSCEFCSRVNQDGCLMFKIIIS